MPRNASGEYSLPANSLAISGQVASSANFNAMAQDIETELTGSLARDGTGGMLGDLDMGGFTITNYANEGYNVRSIYSFADGAAIGNGSVDARAAIVAGLDWAMKNRGMLYFPGGKYSVSAIISIGNTQYDAATGLGTQDDPLAFGIFGDGARSSIIFLPTANTTGSIEIVFTGGTRKWFNCTFRDFGIQVQGTKTYDIFKCTATNTGAGQLNSQFNMMNVDMWGTDEDVPVTSAFICNLNDCNRPVIANCKFIGADTGSNEWDDDDAGFTVKRGLSLDGGYGGLIFQTLIVGAKTGISNIGNAEEGIRVIASGATRTATGFRWIRGGHSTITTITGISKAATGVVTFTGGTTPTAGDNVFLTGGDIPEAYDREFMVGTVVGSTFELKSPIDNTAVNTTAWVGTGTGTFRIHGTTGQQPGPQITDCHFHAREACLDLSGISGYCLRNLNLHCTHGTDVPYNEYGFGIWLKNYQNVLIADCEISGITNKATFSGIYLDAKGTGQTAIVRGGKIVAANPAASGVRISATDSLSRVDDVKFALGDFTTFISNEGPDAASGAIYRYHDPLDVQSLTLEVSNTNAARNGMLSLYRSSTSAADADKLWALEFAGNNDAATPLSNTVTISNATPAVITETTHTKVAGTRVVFSTSDDLPNPIAAGTTYYVIAAGLGADVYRISATLGGAAINTTTAGSGTHRATTINKTIYGSIEGRADDVSETTEDGGLNFYAMTAGTETLVASYGPGWFNSQTAYRVAGTKVVGAQGAAVDDAIDPTSTMNRLNDLLARLRAHGLIAT